MTTNGPRAAMEVARQGTRNSSQIIDITFDVSAGALATLRDASKISPVPFLSNAATIALSIVEVVQRTRSNKAGFRKLAKDSCDIVCDIINAQKEVSQPGEVPIYLGENLEQLVNVLLSIEEFARKGASSNWFIAIVRSSYDARQIRDYQKKLYDAMRVFGLQSNIVLRNTVAHLAANQVAMARQLNSIARVLALPDCMRPSLPILLDIVRPLWESRDVNGGQRDVMSKMVNFEALFHFENLLRMDNYKVIVTQLSLGVVDLDCLWAFIAAVIATDALRFSHLEDISIRAIRFGEVMCGFAAECVSVELRAFARLLHTLFRCLGHLILVL